MLGDAESCNSFFTIVILVPRQKETAWKYLTI
jgi:hypothetical protein